MSVFYGTTDELLAALRGKDLEKYRNEKAHRETLEKEAKQYRSLEPNQWPMLQFNWSLDQESWHMSFDGWESKDINEHNPDGLLLGWVQLQAFDEQLCLHNKRRDNNELWGCGSESKLAYMLAYLSHGNPISPVVVGIATDGQLCLHGGNHRYTAAKFSGEHKFPLLCSVKDKDLLDSWLSIEWCEIIPNSSVSSHVYPK